MEHLPPTHAPLLAGDGAPPPPSQPPEGGGGVGVAIFLPLTLPACLLCSAVAMVLLRSAVECTSPGQGLARFAVGYALEAGAFLFYGLAMHVYPLRTIVACWSLTSMATAVFGGWWLFGETPGQRGLWGCALVGLGIVVG